MLRLLLSYNTLWSVKYKDNRRLKKTLMKIYSKSRFSLELSSYAYSDENEARQYERVFLMLENVVKKKVYYYMNDILKDI